jgi:hypothetical protein
MQELIPMILHDVLAQMLYEDQKRKLNFVTWKGWQFHREENTQASMPRQKTTAIRVHENKCAT